MWSYDLIAGGTRCARHGDSQASVQTLWITEAAAHLPYQVLRHLKLFMFTIKILLHVMTKIIPRSGLRQLSQRAAKDGNINSHPFSCARESSFYKASRYSVWSLS